MSKPKGVIPTAATDHRPRLPRNNPHMSKLRGRERDEAG
jgi:hypothetical protein